MEALMLSYCPCLNTHTHSTCTASTAAVSIASDWFEYVHVCVINISRVGLCMVNNTCLGSSCGTQGPITVSELWNNIWFDLQAITKVVEPVLINTSLCRISNKWNRFQIHQSRFLVKLYNRSCYASNGNPTWPPSDSLLPCCEANTSLWD